jgi:hypothetical protein
MQIGFNEKETSKIVHGIIIGFQQSAPASSSRKARTPTRRPSSIPVRIHGSTLIIQLETPSRRTITQRTSIPSMSLATRMGKAKKVLKKIFEKNNFKILATKYFLLTVFLHLKYECKRDYSCL